LRFEGSGVEPDLMIRTELARGVRWEEAPVPILIIEILSTSTWRRDHNQKCSLYMDAGVAEYWIVDPENSAITSIRLGHADVVSKETLLWSPKGASSSLTIDLHEVFE
jgi:Uma2 family endonuclease